MLLFILLAVATASALRASHRAPVLFVVTTLDGPRPEFRGTSIRTDGAWKYGRVTEDAAARIHAVFPMATVLTINTDDEAQNREYIVEWMERECAHIQRRPKDECFVISSKEYPPFKTATDPYVFLQWESSKKRVVRHPLSPLEIKPLGSSKPTYAVTKSPVVPDACEERAQIDCVGTICKWYGMFHGCKTGEFCGFSTKQACEHASGCQFVRNRCRRKKI